MNKATKVLVTGATGTHGGTGHDVVDILRGPDGPVRARVPMEDEIGDQG